MATLTSQIEALIAYANETTGKDDTTLGAAVKSLADGYKGGGGSLEYNAEGYVINDRGDLELNVTSIGAYAFFGARASNISVTGATTIGTYCFSSAVVSGTISFSDTLKTVAVAGLQCTANKVILPSSVTSLGDLCFRNSNINAIVCLAENPPTLGSSSFLSATMGGIYVPDDSVATYSAASRWSEKKSKIKPLSQLPE